MPVEPFFLILRRFLKNEEKNESSLNSQYSSPFICRWKNKTKIYESALITAVSIAVYDAHNFPTVKSCCKMRKKDWIQIILSYYLYSASPIFFVTKFFVITKFFARFWCPRKCKKVKTHGFQHVNWPKIFDVIFFISLIFSIMLSQTINRGTICPAEVFNIQICCILILKIIHI